MTLQDKPRLLALPTKAEVEGRSQFAEAFVAEVPARNANTLLKIIDAAIPSSTGVDLRHLRRFVKPDNLPSTLRPQVEDGAFSEVDGQLPRNQASSCDTTNDDAADTYNTKGDSTHPMQSHANEPRLHFLVCATSVASHAEIERLLLSNPPFSDSTFYPNLRTLTVPLSPPVSECQAKAMSSKYWPTAYKGSNPFGPQPITLAHATKSIEDQVEQFMDLAVRAGSATSAMGFGEAIGAVVVDRTDGKDAAVIATAGDARFLDPRGTSTLDGANAMAHPVMRVIGMIARKRRSLLTDQSDQPQGMEENFYAEKPVTSLETEIYETSSVEVGGYLCLDLELYVTHEPCIMCCMAINHSRFGKVIFGKRMLTGGLGTEERDHDDSDVGHGTYGLWWRQELNWKFLTWQWIDENDASQIITDVGNIHA